MPDPSPPAPKKPVKIAPPTGTRDFYPREMLVRRYITDAWRRTSLRHGFDEIDGPTFESAELYKVKSGEGILNEMFGVFSGKGLSEPEAQARGAFDPRNPPFGLRPEFTPTLARMYAARAKQLPQPTKWFCVSNFFRAERPQRGRLREFWQWNADVICSTVLDDTADPYRHVAFDVETIAVLCDCIEGFGILPPQVSVRVNSRAYLISEICRVIGCPRPTASDRDLPHLLESALQMADQLSKLERGAWLATAIAKGIPEEGAHSFHQMLSSRLEPVPGRSIYRPGDTGEYLQTLFRMIHDAGWLDWSVLDSNIVRGLAYYTGTVFEVIAEGERAVAGGGRYDNLIELFGGPPTPACGFGMGDAVLGNLLEDRKLIPEGREMLEALARPMPYRPDVFVIASPNPGCEERIVPTVACLRRGEESEKYKQGECKPWSNERYSVPPLHARRSYKATKNVGKLLADAGACHARFAAIIESPEKCTLKNLDSGEQTPDVPLDQLAQRVAASA